MQRKTALKQAQQAASQTSAESESEERARAENEIAAIVAKAKSATTRRLDSTVLGSSESLSAGDGAEKVKDIDDGGDKALSGEVAIGKGGSEDQPSHVSKGLGDHHNGPSLLAASKHIAMTAEDHIRHSAFTDLHDSLFDWMPSTSKDYSTKTYVKHAATGGGAI